MNDQLPLLLQCYTAKRKLAELFQSEEFVQEDQPPIAIGGARINSCNQIGNKQSRRSFREDRHQRGLVAVLNDISKFF